MGDTNSLSPWLFFPLFVGGWFTVSGFLSTLGGWRRLSESFPVPDGFHLDDSDRFRFRSIQVGGVNYGSCVTVGITSHGLYLCVLFPFRFMHPPLLIPWRAIAKMEERRFLWTRWVRMETTEGPTVQLPWGLGDVAREQWLRLRAGTAGSLTSA